MTMNKETQIKKQIMPLCQKLNINERKKNRETSKQRIAYTFIPS